MSSTTLGSTIRQMSPGKSSGSYCEANEKHTEGSPSAHHGPRRPVPSRSIQILHAASDHQVRAVSHDCSCEARVFRLTLAKVPVWVRDMPSRRMGNLTSQDPTIF